MAQLLHQICVIFIIFVASILTFLTFTNPGEDTKLGQISASLHLTLQACQHDKLQYAAESIELHAIHAEIVDSISELQSNLTATKTSRKNHPELDYVKPKDVLEEIMNNFVEFASHGHIIDKLDTVSDEDTTNFNMEEKLFTDLGFVIKDALNIENVERKTATDKPKEGPGFKVEDINHLNLSIMAELRQVKKEVVKLRNVTRTPLVKVGCPSDVLKTRELTSVLSARNESRQAVYFVESTGTGYIKPRYVCAIESAARAYHTGDIYVLIAKSPPGGLNASVNPHLHNVMKVHPNVALLHVDMDKLFLGSPLEQLYRSGKLNASKHAVIHASDVIRALVVWKFGGHYYDLDVVLFKNMSEKNFVIPDAPITASWLANGVFGFAKHSNVGTIYLKRLNEAFAGFDLLYNGPPMFTEAFLKYTGVRIKEEIPGSNIKEFAYFPEPCFFPIHFYGIMEYFENKAWSRDYVLNLLASVKCLWGIHISNSATSKAKITVGSQQAYGVLAEKYCPYSYWTCGDEF